MKGRWVFVPDGWQVVPKEPTRKQIIDACAAYDAADDVDNAMQWNSFQAAYYAALAASPSPW